MGFPTVNLPQRKRDHLAHITIPMAVAAHIVSVTEQTPIYLPLLVVSIATVYHIWFIGSTVTEKNSERKKAKISKRTRESTKKHINRVRMCKSIVVSETTLRNYNSMIKEHAQEIARNQSTMKYSDGLTNMEFHGGSTVMSVLVVIFILLGLYLSYHPIQPEQ